MARLRVLPLLAVVFAGACDSPFLHDVVERKAATDRGGCLVPDGGVDAFVVVLDEEVATLSWSSAASDENGFVVERRSSIVPTWGELIRLAPDATSYSDGQVERDAEYTYRVSAFRISGGQTCSSAASQELAVVTRPNAVAQVAAVSRAARNELGWNDVNLFEDGVRVERRVGAGAYELLGTTAVDANSYVDDAVTAGESYGYRLTAFNAAGDAEPVEVAVTAVRPPVLAWGADPSFEAECVLRVPGVATIDEANGASFESASGAVDLGTPPPVVAADASGLTAQLSELTPGDFDVSWSVLDSAGGSVTLERTLSLSVAAAVRGPARRASRGLSESNAEGTQALMPACADCTDSPASITAGPDHTCVVTTAGEVQCWGGDYYYRDISNAYYPGCVAEDGGVYGCSTGKLGHGGDEAVLTVAAACAGTPEDDCGGSVTGLAQVDAGSESSCAVTSGGEVHCWGYNSGGVLGDGTSQARRYPGPVCLVDDGSGGCVTPLTGATAVSVGGYHACALVAGGAVYCWGSNDTGQLGDGTTTDSYVATPVCATGSGGTCVPLVGVKEVSAGDSHTCAIDDQDRAWCWGDNSESALGNAGSPDAPNPVPVCSSSSGCPQLAEVLEIEASRGFSCARVGASGPAAVVCWGSNGCGYLGDGDGGDCFTFDVFKDVPVPVCLVDAGGAACADPLDDAVQLSAGLPAICARRANGEVVCWGGNGADELGYDDSGDTPFTDYAVPVCATGAGASCVPMTGVTSLTVGSTTSCAIAGGGRVYCWGWAGDGALGYGGVGAVGDPMPACRLDGLGCTPVTDLTALAAGSNHVCGLAGGKLYCWGQAYYSAIPIPNRDYRYNPRYVVTSPGADAERLTGIVSVSAGVSTTCGLRDDGSVWCWGHNYAGQRGSGEAEPTGQSHASAVCASGAGPGCPRLAGVTSLSVGDNFACAVLFDGHVRCWGLNDCGQLGNGDMGACDGAIAQRSGLPVPVCVSGRTADCTRLTGAVSVSAGYAHACAVTEAGEVWCWGYNLNGQLGDGTVNHSRVATPVCLSSEGPDCPRFSDAVAVVAGVEHTCAITEDGEARCWGYNGCGALGMAAPASCSTSSNQLRPVVVCSAPGTNCAPLRDIVAMGVGGDFSCALLLDGSVRCWGRGYDGQLGIGDWPTTEVVPTAVCAGDGASDACDGTCAGPLGGAVALATGEAFACVVLQSGELRCWGANGVSQHGNGAASAYYYCAAVPTCDATGEGEDCGGGASFSDATLMSCDVYSVEEAM